MVLTPNTEPSLIDLFYYANTKSTKGMLYSTQYNLALQKQRKDCRDIEARKLMQ